MNEKSLYHTALEDELLSGKKLKAKLDAKLSGSRAASPAPERRTESDRSGRLQKWITIPAAAILLVLTVALGVFVVAHGRKNTQHPGDQPFEDPETPAPTETLPVTERPGKLPVTPEPDVLPTPKPTFSPEPTPTEHPDKMPKPTPTEHPDKMPKPTPTATRPPTTTGA